MRKQSWDSLAPSFEHYAYAAAVGRFVARAAQELQPLALILFGSLARGDFHQRSDADFCVILAKAPPTPLAAYTRVATCDPTGVVQPVVFGRQQFLQMIQQATGLALEVTADGIFLAGDEAIYQEIEQATAQARERWDIVRTPSGWRIGRPELVESLP